MLSISPAAAAPFTVKKITPSHVYAQAERIYADVLTLKTHNKPTTTTTTSTTTTFSADVQLKPRHVWQKTYEILVKLNIYRRAQGYPTLPVSALEPFNNLPPGLVYDQTQRILTEIKLIKEHLNIAVPTPAARHFSGKMPKHVYRMLSRASAELDTINGKNFTPSHVFAQAFRINNDIDLILDALNIRDTSIPPAKHHNSRPDDALKVGMALMQNITRLQRRLSIPVTDFSSLQTKSATPADVFSLIGLISAELQEIKFTLSLRHQPTEPSRYYTGKTPADVEQLLGWCNNKIDQAHDAKF
ncbi:MAG: hypothetical protein R8K53_01000 [Mariprofundaceae bacterium]